MWFFEPIAQFYNWFLVLFGVEDIFVGSVFILFVGFAAVITLVFITNKIKWLDPFYGLILSMSVLFAFVMLPLSVLNDSLRECKKEIITHIEEYDAIVYVNNCRYRTDMNGEFGEWELTDVLHLETLKQKFKEKK